MRLDGRPDHHRGPVDLPRHRPLSCTSGAYSGTRKITWNNGRTSTLSFKSAVSVNAGQSLVAIKGEVTDGEFSGQKWSAAFTMFTARPASCATRGGPAHGVREAAARCIGSPATGATVARHGPAPTLH